MKRISEIRIDIPKYPKLIIDTLQDFGYEAYIVGGCVRDVLLGKTPSDYDITTNAKPEEIKKLFKRTMDIGIKHGTVTVLFYENDKPMTYEVTTFRLDGEYDDARHPKSVEFVNDLKEDLLRRDFTINAMAYNDKRGLVDEFGGIVDLQKKIVRAVGSPTKRFTEDALRLLRAIRFSAKLGFEIEEETKNAIPKLAENLINVSKERVQVELTKILTSDNPEYISKVFELGLANYISDNFDLIKPGKFAKTQKVHIAYACLFYNTNIAVVNQIMRNLKLDNSNISKVISLLESKRFYEQIKKDYYAKSYSNYRIDIKELVNYLGYELVYDFITILSINEAEKKLISKVLENINYFKDEKHPIFVKDLKIGGNEIMDIGFKGVEVGFALSELLKIVHKNSAYNNKKLLQELAKKAYNTYKGVPYELH